MSLQNPHGISYPNRLRKNVMMVRIFNGYLSETQDEAMEKYIKVETKEKAMGHVKRFLRGIGKKK